MLDPSEFKSVVRNVRIPKYLVDFADKENLRFTDVIRGVLEDRYKEVHGTLPVRPGSVPDPTLAERRMKMEKRILTYPAFRNGRRAKRETLVRWASSTWGGKPTPHMVRAAIDRMIDRGVLVKFRSRDGRSNSKREYWYVGLAEE